MTVISSSYTEENLGKREDGESDDRVVLRLPAPLAPVKAAVMPLVKKDGQPDFIFMENYIKTLQNQLKMWV